MPTPVLLGRDILRGRGGLVKDWKDWFTRHTCLEDNIKAGAEVVGQWWAYTGVPHPGKCTLYGMRGGGNVDQDEDTFSSIWFYYSG